MHIPPTTLPDKLDLLAYSCFLALAFGFLEPDLAFAFAAAFGVVADPAVEAELLLFTLLIARPMLVGPLEKTSFLDLMRIVFKATSIFVHSTKWRWIASRAVLKAHTESSTNGRWLIHGLW